MAQVFYVDQLALKSVRNHHHQKQCSHRVQQIAVQVKAKPHRHLTTIIFQPQHQHMSIPNLIILIIRLRQLHLGFLHQLLPMIPSIWYRLLYNFHVIQIHYHHFIARKTSPMVIIIQIINDKYKNKVFFFLVAIFVRVQNVY